MNNSYNNENDNHIGFGNLPNSNQGKNLQSYIDHNDNSMFSTGPYTEPKNISKKEKIFLIQKEPKYQVNNYVGSIDLKIVEKERKPYFFGIERLVKRFYFQDKISFLYDYNQKNTQFNRIKTELEGYGRFLISLNNIENIYHLEVIIDHSEIQKFSEKKINIENHVEIEIILKNITETYIKEFLKLLPKHIKLRYDINTLKYHYLTVSGNFGINYSNNMICFKKLKDKLTDLINSKKIILGGEVKSYYINSNFDNPSNEINFQSVSLKPTEKGIGLPTISFFKSRKYTVTGCNDIKMVNDFLYVITEEVMNCKEPNNSLN